MSAAATRPIGAPIEPPPIAERLPWRSWEDGRAEARRTGRPLLVFAEPEWTTSSQRLALHLSERPEACAWLEEHWVSVLLDPWQHPDLAAWLRFEAVTITGDPGPPLLVLLDARARPFLAYGTLAYEGAADHPSLESLLRAAFELHQEEPERLRREAEKRTRHSLVAAPARSEDFIDALLNDADTTHGGFRAGTKVPQPQALLALLEAHDRDPAARVAALLEATLVGLERGGIVDQLGYGFHRAARDERWVVPHFEKPVPISAALANVFARAGQAFGVAHWLELAGETLDWVTMALEAEWDAVAADSGYYTWTAQEVRRLATPDTLQVLGIHYHLTPSPLRIALHQAVPVDRLADFSNESDDVLRDRLESGRDQLRTARRQRLTPATLAAPGPSWSADALVMAYACALALERDTSALDRVSELLARRIDAEASVARADGAIYLEDEAGVAHALLVAARASGRRSLGDAGARLLDAVLGRQRAAGDLPLRVPEPATGETPSSRFGVFDHDLASPVSHLLAALRLAPDRLTKARGRIIQAHGTASACDPVRAAGFWREAMLATPEAASG